MKIRILSFLATAFAFLLMFPVISSSVSAATKIWNKTAGGVWTTTKFHISQFVVILLTMFVLIVALGATAMAAARYSVASGNWNATTTWSAISGGASGASAPVAGDDVTIENNYTVTVTANAACATMSIASGSQLTVNANFTMTFTGAVTVNGTWRSNSTGAASGGTITFNSGSTYNHNVDGGTIPTATWNVSSNCNIIGYVNQAGGTGGAVTAFQSSFNQTFGNFTWNSTGQTAAFSLAGQISNIRGNLTIISTGTGSLALGGTNAGNLTVGGNFSQTGGNFIISQSAARTMTVAGNFSLSGGTFDMSSSTTAANVTTLNLAGNVNLTAGTLTETGSTTGSVINFNGTSTQTFTSGATLSNVVNFAIPSGATVDFGTSVISNGSSGTFTIASGGSLITANTAGITTTGATGTIQVTGTRTYTSGANYTYDGTANQVTGNGLSQNTPANVTINNPGHTVTLSANTNMSGILTATAGSTLALSTFTLGATTAPTSVVLYNGSTASTISGTGALTLGGDVTVNYTGGSGSGALISCPVALGTATRTFTVADETTAVTDLTVSGIISGGAGGAVTKAGAGTMLLSGTNTYSGATTINTGMLKVGNASALGTTAGITSVASGAVLDLNGTTLSTAEPLTLNGTGIASGGALINSSATAVNYTGAITLGSASSIGTTGNITLGGNGITGGYDLTKVGSATLNLGTGTATLGSLIISAGTLTSTSGTMNLTGNFTNNSTFTHNSGTVIFNGSSAQTIGGSSNSTFYNLTINNAAGVTLGANETVSNILTLTSGKVATTSSYYLAVTNTSSGAVTGYSSSSYINGSLQWSLASGGSYLFPVGDASNYRPFELNSITCSSPVVRVTMSSAGASTVDATLSAVAARNWYAQLISGTFTSATVRITESGLGSTNVVASSSAQSGNYTNRGGNSIGSTITSNAGISYTGSTYFAIGQTLAVLTIIKTADKATVVTGDIITYTITIKNTGAGPATSVVIDDLLSPYIQWGLDSYGVGAPFQFVDGTPSSGLTLGTPVYSNNSGSTWVYTPVSGGGGAPAGYDGNVTNWRIPMSGTMNANNASFTINYKVRVK